MRVRVRESGKSVFSLTVLSFSLKGIPPGAEFIHAKQTTTSVWVMMCIEAQTILPISSNPMFTPFDLAEDDVPLDGCVITITGYSGCERENLCHLAGLLGAHAQELFVRKTKPGKPVC